MNDNRSLLFTSNLGDRLLYLLQVNSQTKVAKFSFKDVTPGDYKLSAHRALWCWKKENQEVKVYDRDVSDVSLEHSGYQLVIQSTHHLNLVR